MSLLDYYTENPDEKTKTKLRQLLKVTYLVIKMAYGGPRFSAKSLKTLISSFEKSDAVNNKATQLNLKEISDIRYVNHRLSDLVNKKYLKPVRLKGPPSYEIIDLKRLENDWWKLLDKLTKQI